MENKCLCGCGGNHSKVGFIPGHDGKLKSTLLKVERGELALSSIPKVAIEHRKEIAFVQANGTFKRLVAKASRAVKANLPKTAAA